MTEAPGSDVRPGGPFRLDGRRALATGARRGIGEAVARSLAAFGVARTVDGTEREEGR
jgi:NAD(P)-dependent dehydrogenase (short-subunit alcohol dehydrogenase family)